MSCHVIDVCLHEILKRNKDSCKKRLRWLFSHILHSEKWRLLHRTEPDWYQPFRHFYYSFFPYLRPSDVLTGTLRYLINWSVCSGEVSFHAPVSIFIFYFNTLSVKNLFFLSGVERESIMCDRAQQTYLKDICDKRNQSCGLKWL